MRLPEIDFHYSRELYKFFLWLFRMTGKLYTVDEMMAMDKSFIMEAFAYEQGKQFYIDYPKRDPHFQ